MKNLLFALILLLAGQCMAANTYYWPTTSNNWSAAVWRTTSGTAVGSSGPPVSGDTAYFDANSGGTCTISAAATCATCTMTNNGATLAFGAQSLTIQTAITLGGTITAGGGSIFLNNAATMTCAGVTFPGNVLAIGAGVVMGGDWLIAGVFSNNSVGGTSITGAHNMTVGTLKLFANTGIGSMAFPAGKTLTVTTNLVLVANAGFTADSNFVTWILKSGTINNRFNLIYQGTIANCKICGMNFIDVDASGSSILLLNYFGGTLTNTVNIVNATGQNLVNQMGMRQ